MHSLVIFASGTGTNAAAIIAHFKSNRKAKVSLIVSNRVNAGVLNIAREEDIPYLIVDKNTFQETLLTEQLRDASPSLIILAGFLWKIPERIVREFPNRIVNIHPALLPKYGGKGMYGNNVHHAVLGAKDAESGITIHYVNEVYDEGNIILQARCRVAAQDTTGDLAVRIHGIRAFLLPAYY